MNEYSEVSEMIEEMCRTSRKETQSKRFTYHPQVEAITPYGDTINCDEPMLPLLKKFWKHNIETFFSCEGTEERINRLAYVMFKSNPGTEDFIKFLEYNSNFKNAYKICMDFDTTKDDFNALMNCDYIIEIDHFFPYERVCIRFPKNEIKFFTELL